MSFFKTVSILLVAALANPWCCCYASVSAADLHSDAEPATAVHNCCSAEEKSDMDPTHGADDCPHQYGKDAQISGVADSFDGFAKPLLAVAYELTELPSAHLAWHDSELSLPNLHSAPGWTQKRLSQEYCVYRL